PWLAAYLSLMLLFYISFFFSSRRRHTRSKRDWSSDVCSSDLCQMRKKVPLKNVPFYTKRKFLEATTSRGGNKQKAKNIPAKKSFVYRINICSPEYQQNFFRYLLHTEIGRASCRKRM